MAEDRVCVGVVVGAHGIKGQLRIKSFTADPMDIAAYGPVFDDNGRPLTLTVTGETKGVVIGILKGITDRNAAEALKGAKLHVPRSALPETREDEFYHADLIGLAVETFEGARLGTVAAIYDFGAGDVLELKQDDGGMRMLPFTRAVVPV
ncbi:MAG: ribosome maturation factor RimM, partial [Rhodospirillales bacterium]|nr:ribosome maturation factor RimM [Rhodospirillales bacterium]